MSIKRINEFPEGSGSLSSDDLFLFMDDPSGNGITKKISLSQLSNTISIGGGGNPFDQNLNTTDFPTFSGISLSNTSTLAQGSFDNSTGGNGGISLNCVVGYELNWQGGHLKSTQDNGMSAANIYCDSPLEFPGSGIDNMQIDSSGITYADGTTQNSANISTSNIIDFNSGVSGLLTGLQPSGNYANATHNHISSDITDFNNSVSGLLPVKNITAGSGIEIINSSGSFTINATLVSNPVSISGASAITNIVQISQVNYNAILTPNPQTLYIIVG